MKTSLTFLVLLIASLLVCSVAQAQDVGAAVILTPPYSGRVSDYTDLSNNDQVFVDLDNPGSSTLSFYLLGRITRNGSPFVAMDNNFRPARPIELSPEEMRSFDGSTLAELNLNFDSDNVTGLSGEQQTQILLDDALPEGEYVICIRAFDFDSGDPLTINGEDEYCTLSFDVVQGGFPELLTPEDGEAFDPDVDEEIFISWAYNGSETGVYDLRYTVKLIDLTEHNIDPSTATMSMFDPGVPVLYETDPGGTSDLTYTYGFDPIDPPLVAGHVYAVRVTAFEAEDLLFFPLGGHSEVHVFSYGTPDGGGAGCVDPNYRIQAVYPMAGDTLPFNYTPCVARVDPLCDDYRLFEFSLDLNAAVGVGYDRTEDNRWGAVGPVGYLSNLLGTTVTRERASHFVFNLEDEQNAAMGQLQAGVRYDWEVSTTMHQRGGNAMTGATTNQEWIHGMPRPRLQSPAHESVVAPGEIRLSYRTGDAPNTLIPAHLNLIRAAGVQVLGQQSMGNVTEACVVQVARNETFEAEHIVDHQLVDVSLTNFSGDGAAISAALYKALDFTVTAVDTGDYFWRVVWLVDPSVAVPSNGELAETDVYHTSATWKFTIDPEGDTPETPDPENSDCSANCIVAAPASTGAISTLAVDETFLMGKFTVTVKEVSGSTTFNGEGEVVIPFANDIKIRVGFTNVKINSDRKAYAGLVTALEDEHPFNVSQQLGVGGQSIPSLPQNELALLNDFLDDGERLVSGFAGRRTIGLPIGIDRDFSGHRVTLGVVKMTFEPTVAKLDVVCAFPIPDFDDYVGLGVGDWCFNPDGLGNEGRVYMADDLTLNAGDDVEFSISGGAAADTTQITYAEFDCTGIVCLQLRGELRFDTSMIKPDPVTSPAPDDEVTAFLRTKICWQDGLDFLAQAHIDAFVVPDADKFTFKETDIWIDFSDRENPNPMATPDGYRWTGASARERNTWKGIYIPRVLMSIPREVVDDPAYEVGVDNFIVDWDPFAISVRAVAINLVPEGEANIDGWGITVDTVYLAMIQTRDVEAGIKGRLEMPLTDEGEHLLYRAAINTSGVEIGVSVDPRDPLTAPIMAAELTLERNTYLNIYLGTNSGIAANLNGEISITGEQARSQASSGSSPSMNMPGVKFQGVGFDTRVGTSSSGTWRFASPQKSAVGFPLQIDSMGLDLSSLETPGFFIKPRLTLMGEDGGISGAAMLHFHARNVTLAGGRKKWKLDRVSLSEINLDVVISQVTLKGYIRWTESETVEEIAGGIDITIPMGIRGKMDCTFGTYRSSQTATFGTAQYYSYWQVDGLIQFNPGLQIFSGFAIYGVGGGVSYHMRKAGAATPAASAVRNAPETTGTPEGGDPASTEVANEPTPSGVRYTADHSAGLGLELTLILGTFPKPDAFNADITLRAQFEDAGGLSLLQLTGDGYFMTGINERASSNKMVWASLDISYRPLDEELHGTFDVYLDVAGVLVGNASGKRMVNATIHVDPSMWYFYLGTYRDRGGIALTVGGEPLANLTEYLMIGHGVPVDLPEIEHDRLRNLLSVGGDTGGGSNNVESDEDAINAQRAEGYSNDADKLHEGKGFAFGTAFSTSAFINPVPIYLEFEIALGMDALVAQVPEGLVCAETGERPGANGWRVAGQVYAGIWGELGIGVKIIRRFTIPIVSLAAGFQLEAKVPNPNYFAGVAAVEYSVLGGAISGRKRMAFEFGADCELISNDPLADIQVLESIGPNGQQSVYAQAAATFNFPINKVLELPRTIPDDGPPTFWRFKPYIAGWTIKKGATSVATEAIKIKEGGFLATLEPTGVLDPFSNFQTDISIRFTNLTAGRNEVYRDPETNAIHQEDSTATFRTGARPVVIPKEAVKYTYPIANQRHFLPGVTDRKGILAQTRAHNYLFYRTQEGRDYDYILRYIPLSDGEPIDVPQTDLAGRELNFQVPEGLTTETIYSVQLIRVRRQTAMELASERVAALNINTSNVFAGNVPAHMQALTRLNFAGGDYRVTQVTRQVNHTDVERPDLEFKLFQWYFRTSKFYDLDEKLASLSLTGQTPHNGMGSYGAYVRGSIDEHFDQYEVNGFYFNGERVLPPLIKFIPNLGDDYYSYQITNTYAQLSRLRSFRRIDINMRILGVNIETTVGVPAVPSTNMLSWLNSAIASDYYLDRDRSWVVPPIRPSEIGNASSITSTISSGTMSLGQQYGISANTGGLGLGLPTGGFNFGGGLPSPPAGPSYNFGLVFRAPWRVDRDLQAVRSYTSRVLGTYVGIENVNGSYRVYHRYSGSARPSSSVIDVSIIPSFRNNHPSEYYTLRSLSNRHWREVAAFTNQTPRLPMGSEFAQQQSNSYRVRITYAVPGLGAQSLTRNFNLTTNNAPSTLGVGPF